MNNRRERRELDLNRFPVLATFTTDDGVTMKGKVFDLGRFGAGVMTFDRIPLNLQSVMGRIVFERAGNKLSYRAVCKWMKPGDSCSTWGVEVHEDLYGTPLKIYLT